MDKKNRRSSLRRQPPTKEDDQTATSTMQNSMLKRRISFSGKKSVRVFVNTEEPHYWENSYELSDCTNGEDNSKEQAPKTGPSRQAPTADKENVHIDMTLNLRTSIDVPMFPCETNRDPPNCSVPRESLFAESFSLSSIGREKLKDKLYSHRITDKTIDLMQITSKVGDDCSLDLSTLKKEHMKGQPTTFVSDSLMDITPLGFVDPVAASVPVPVEKDNDNPVQKSFKEVEECRKDSQRQGDISFDCDINDFSARDRMPSNGSSDTDSNNSTINYLGDESALIPFDMISGNNISKKLNFRQLNDDLEAGKIKVFANGPRTPTTDPRAKQKKFWHGLDEDLDQDQQHKDINIRSIKPRGPLNFSVNMTMSPLAQATPVARVAPLPREKLKIPDDKRKYRLSQADEVMLDNTNFLAHAKLGDETQSRNSSKIFTRRETTYESLELDVGLPNRSSSCSQNFPPSTMQEAASKHSKPRQTIHLPAKMEQDVFQVEQAATAIPPGRSSSSSARRTLNLNESMDQDIVEEKAIVTQSEVNVTHKGAKSKRRETLLMEESMEEDIISPLKELHLKASAPPKEKEKSKTRQTLHLAKPLEEDEALPRNAATTVAIGKDSKHLAEAVQERLPMGNHRYKARQTILQAEPIEEDFTGTGATRKDYEHLPEARYKARQTILQAEPIEEDVTAPGATRKDYEHLPEAVQKHLPMANHRYKARQTILQAESIEEDVTAPGATRKDYEHLPEARYKARQTILQAEPIEEDVTAPGATRKDYEHLPEAVQKHLPMANHRYKARQTILQAEPIEEDVTAPGATRKDYEHLPEAIQKHLPTGNHRYKARQTILQAEPIEEDVTAPEATRKDYEHLPEAVQKHLPTGNHRYKARQTILQAEPVEEDVTRKDYEHLPEAIKEHLPTGNHRYKCRQTILQAEPIEEDVTPRKDCEHLPEKKDYKHLAEPVQAHHVSDSRYRSSKSRQALLMAEAIEENHSTAYHSLEPKISQEVRENSVAFEPINTLPLSELIEESKAAIRTSKARQTLPLAAPMEVEGEEPPTEPPLEESTKVAPSRGSRAQQTLIMSESMEEQEEEVDFHSPIQSIRTHPELLPITPMLRLNGSGSVCSMDEFELFEEESKQAATPRGPFQKASVLLRKIHSMGESMKMSFEEDTSGCGTPIRHSGNAKRLSDHLTPNLPEAKKRNTHLFADSKTEQEMEMEMDMSVSIKEVTTAVDKNCDLILRPQRPVLEQRPVTISDVSAYFQAQPCKVKKKPAESKTEKEDEEKRDTCPRYSGSSTDRSFKSYEPTNKRFINLSGDTNSSTALMGTISVDEMETSHIDKVRLSLVSTLADEPDTDEEAPVEGAAALAKQPQPEPESCQEQQASSRVVAAGSSASCRKCMNCRRSLNETRLSNDSFVLPSQPQWDLTREIEMLRRVRARPNLDDVHKYWEMKEQERQTIALEKELDNSRDASDEEEFSEWDVNEVMAGYNRKMERFKRNLADNPDILQQALVRFEPVETFFDRLAGLLTEQQPNWIFDYQLKISRKLIFTHRLLTTFRLIVDYETVDDLETAIRVCALNVEQATLILPLQSWTAFEHLLDFQLQLKLPVSHTDSIEGSSVEAFAQFLQRTDTICVDVLRTFHKLLKVLTTTKASLLRQGNQMVIKKTVRRRIEMDTRTAIEKTDFVIEVANVEGISFRDILHPRIHLFNENIQYLPVGVAFLEEFLDHPEQYLKT
ncbi:uncharacterized protein Spc105R isoform X8 [Drosophila pseudoobscura]|uniref:Uncharacterized protein Spc105R isoform X8 n=1 Tax=Drosophila pseudoobscura pseudoobscura TaxID=46245 RepID=A0A6I8WBC0_DROPS|nr:uncharacterized protein LOC6900295 isoform X8 [Drosophila pseudoobscura]